MFIYYLSARIYFSFSSVLRRPGEELTIFRFIMLYVVVFHHKVVSHRKLWRSGKTISNSYCYFPT